MDMTLGCSEWHKKIGKWLGIVEVVGPVMIFYILPFSFIPAPRLSVVSIQSHELDLDLPKVQ